MTATAGQPATGTAAETPPGGRGRLRGVRWAGAGLADQALIALANAGTTLLAAALLSREQAAGPILAIAVGYFVIGINRAFVGEVLVALASRYDGERRDRLVRNGFATSVTLGLLASAVFVVIWAVSQPNGRYDLHNLIWLAPFLPMVLLQDAARYSYLADRRPDRALAIDLVWFGTQAAVVAGSLLAVGASGAWLLIAWGSGATAGATVFLVRARPALWRGDPRRWLEQTRQLSGWFTATALVGQFQTLAVNFLVPGRLGKQALSGLRTAQTVLMQPVQNFQLAVQGLLVPRLSRLAHAATRSQHAHERAAAAAAFRRQVRLVAAAFAGLAALMVAVVWPAASTVLRHIPKFADIAPLALPISLQAGIYLIQVPFTAALRGMHRARMLFAQYVAFTTTSLTGLVVGSGTGSLVGAVWGLFTGTATGLVVMISLYGYAVRRLRPDGEPRPDDELRPDDGPQSDSEPLPDADRVPLAERPVAG